MFLTVLSLETFGVEGPCQNASRVLGKVLYLGLLTEASDNPKFTISQRAGFSSVSETRDLRA